MEGDDDLIIVASSQVKLRPTRFFQMQRYIIKIIVKTNTDKIHVSRFS